MQMATLALPTASNLVMLQLLSPLVFKAYAVRRSTKRARTWTLTPGPTEPWGTSRTPNANFAKNLFSDVLAQLPS